MDIETEIQVERDKQIPFHVSDGGLEREKTPIHGGDGHDDNHGAGPAPDGGLEAWLVVAGCFCTFFCCLGFANSFGTLADYYISHQLRHESVNNIAWIGSLSAFLQFFSGMVGGPLFDRFGAKVIRPSAIIYVFAMMMLSLCKTYWQFMLSQAILIGTVMGLLQFPTMAAVSQFFDKKRAAAIGIGISGSSVGGIIIPMALSKMLNGTNLGFGWSIRVIGFLIMPFLAFSIFAVKPRLPPRTRSFWLSAAFKDTRLIVLTVSLFFTFMGMFMPLFFIPTYGTIRGMDATLAGYLSAILNASSTFGRIIPGILADRVGKLNVYAAGSLATGIVILCMNEATSSAAIIAYSIVFGFTSGTIVSGASAAFTVCCPDVRDVGTYAGMGMAIGSTGGLIGPPLVGVMIDHYHGFFQAAMYAGSSCLFGSLVAFGNKYWTPEGLLGKA